ncbi:MAG TPA: diguanylate cyclase, partial [Rhodocyclaceae bacterium]|nr:diguanylate cyclase [Rhodocyclaceae bacterium]
MSAKLPQQENAAVLGNLAAQDQLRLLWRVYQQHREAVLITDRNNRIIAVNAAFAEMTGYAEEEVLGRDPKMLASGHTTAAEYAAMWRALRENGVWQGEFWDRHRDGTICPKLATITVIRDDQEQVTHYVATFSDLTLQKATAEHIVRLAHHDDLTGLLNRHALQAQLQQTLAGARRDGHQVAILLIDLDRFKDINDTLGHPVGDRLLIEMAKRLASSVRASDTVARLGGDEFVVVLPNVDNAMTVASIASKIRRNLSDLYRIDEHSLYATPSIGITLYPMDGDNAEILIKNADTAMYHAKAAGRDNFKFFAATMNAAAMERLKLETALRQALESTTLTNAQFRLEYQPQLHLDTGRIVGLEALARWHHPQFGQISPARFIPVAEETGLIQPLGDWVFWEACRQLRVFKDMGARDVRVAVNLSAQQLREEALPSLVRGALACYDLSPGELELEITESAAMQNPEITIAILEKLSDIGIVLAIDDFG